MIYCDSAATSWPKPDVVYAAMADYLDTCGNPGRSGHSFSISAARIIYAARESIAELYNASDPLRVIFTINVTEALNLAMLGILAPGDHVVTTSMEHNSVMRPLRALERKGVRLSVATCKQDGRLDLDAMSSAIVPGTKMVVVNHASNIVGTIQPIAEIAALAHAAGALLLVDTAQTSGALPIDQSALGIDLLAFTGHKSLLGPTGTGGLVIGDAVDLDGFQPVFRGGTGSRSEYEEQPEELPDRFESGTANGVGLAGLGASVRWILERGVDSIREHECMLTRTFLEGLTEIPSVTIYGTRDASLQTSVVSCRIGGYSVSDVGFVLDDEFGILSRVGLHCAPTAHKTIGTFPEGTIRISFGPFTTSNDVSSILAAIETLVKRL